MSKWTDLKDDRYVNELTQQLMILFGDHRMIMILGDQIGVRLDQMDQNLTMNCHSH